MSSFLKSLPPEEEKHKDYTEIDWPFEELLGDHLLIYISEFRYSGRIVIPDHAKRLPTKGVVVMTGPLVTDIEIGQLVLYSQFAGFLLQFEGLPPCRIISRSELLGKLKPTAPRLMAESA
jgi:hypothetical protein